MDREDLFCAGGSQETTPPAARTLRRAWETPVVILATSVDETNKSIFGPGFETHTGGSHNFAQPS
jgi:hypothetical protein